LAGEAVDMMVLQMTAGVSDALIHAATMPDGTWWAIGLTPVESSLRPTVETASDLGQDRHPTAVTVTRAGPRRSQIDINGRPKLGNGKYGLSVPNGSSQTSNPRAIEPGIAAAESVAQSADS
jgi:hypothetical protein